jgi:glucosylceramidase
MVKSCTAGLVAVVMTVFALSVQPLQGQGQVEEWLSRADRTSLLARQSEPIELRPVTAGGTTAVASGTTAGASGTTAATTIDVTGGQRFQTIDGFGFALTGGSAELMMKMTPEKRHALIEELFGTGKKGGEGAIGVSYIRITIGSSDMNERVFTYDDIPAGQEDMTLAHFDLGPDLKDVVPVVKEILKVDPKIEILASPWSAPSWMKTNDDPKGGSLKPDRYDVYARFLVKYLETMKAQGIRIDAITMQNEPLNPKNTPSMSMTSAEQGKFLKDSLGPLLRKTHTRVKVILYDHNCDRPDYPMDILADKDAAQYADGSGFHLYGGTIDAMTRMHDAYPDKNLYFTEQMTVEKEQEVPFHLAQPVSRVVIGATRNWSRTVLLWNLAADSHYGPHTDNGGCPMCQGAITIDGDKVQRNIAFYAIAHVSKFVRPGSVRIASTETDTLQDVAFETPDHRKVLLVANKGATSESLRVLDGGRVFRATLGAGDVGTFLWK